MVEAMTIEELIEADDIAITEAALAISAELEIKTVIHDAALKGPAPSIFSNDELENEYSINFD